MTKYRAINGWTRASMKARIREGNNGTRAYVLYEGCMYLTPDGNRCAVGCFVPDGHPCQSLIGFSASTLVRTYPSIIQLMPLEVDGLSRMQDMHDSYDPPGGGDVRDALDQWIDANVLDPGEPAPDGEDVA